MWSGFSPAMLHRVARYSLGILFAIYCAGAAYAALYLRDGRKLMEHSDLARYHGAGVLMCYTEIGTLERAAAAWLVGAQDIVVLNAHNFVDRKLTPTHPITDCFFRIAGADFYFDDSTLRLGASLDSKELRITDDWALVRLLQPVPGDILAQPIPDMKGFATDAKLKVVIASPAGHSNSRLPATIESCSIQKIDEPSDAHIRRARHDCNDGYGGSGSGLFTEDGHLVALHSASLDMNMRRPFDIETHYGSALLFEGDLTDALRRAVAEKRK